ncbi:MAG: hypothetical protein KDI36_08340, partial [Pseudomonadales bacterium]|nr:hypothetical protein [Pseudomonadales bacterium]
MTEELSITYEGARLALSFSDPPQAALRINGLIRETAASEQSNITLKLTSTVQTDYEWHEFIEGIVEFSDKGIK